MRIVPIHAFVAALAGTSGCAFSDEFSKVGPNVAGACDSVKLPAPKSCAVATTPTNGCGPSGKDDCCATLCVPAASFKRGFDGAEYMDGRFDATVSTFVLDKYEVTVGRVRAWIDSGSYKLPLGAGAHPKASEAAWNDAWNTPFPASPQAFRKELDDIMSTLKTWKNPPGNASAEALPANYLNWYGAYAFCIWDGGRLPTEAEWNAAAAGGAEQRVYPWSTPPGNEGIGDGNAGYGCQVSEPNCVPRPAGSRLGTGDGARWGHADMAGNLAEWVLDGVAWTVDGQPTGVEYRLPCDDCVGLTTFGRENDHRAYRGGAFNSGASGVKSSWHASAPALASGYEYGFRCARDVAP